jgi:accessory gene regulator B
MDSIVSYFEKEFELSEIDKAKLKYSLDVLFTDISKLLILLIIFSIFGKTEEFIFSVLALLTIRPFTGGLHFNTYLGCFLFTTLFFSSVIVLHSIVPLNNFLVFFFAFSFITMLCVAPIAHKNRPGYSKDKNNQFKILGLVVISIHFLSYLLAIKNPYLNISIWVITLQSIQLLIRKGVDMYEKRKIIH